MKKQILWVIESYLIFTSTNIYAQDKIITLSSPVSQTSNYVARDAIFLKTGFLFNSSSSITLTGKIDESSVLDADYSTTPIDPTTRQVNTSRAVGFTQGSASVSPTGAANYQIPIHIPQGIAGMQPSLAIAYNSQGGNSILGVGWNISGISAITRVPKTIYNNGATGGINFKYSDIYSLDGNRLLALTGGYGNLNTTYETEVKTFSKVESFGYIAEGSVSTGPSWFRVTTKEGNIVEYGNSPDSKVTPGGKSAPLMWLVNRITDPNGNFMKFSYTSLNGESAIEKIEYTGNGSYAASNSILFFYDKKSDNKTGYISGRSIDNALLLRKIKVVTEGVTVRTYSFGYNIINTKTCLNLVTETSSDGSTLNSTVIGWGDENTSITPTVLQINNLNPFATPSDRKWSSGDVDGDGITELLCIYECSKISTQSYLDVYRLENGSKLNLIDQIQTSYNLVLRDYIVLNAPLLLADIEGDGKKNIIFPIYENNYLYFRDRMHCRALQPLPPTGFGMPACTTGDFNNDGTDEIVYTTKYYSGITTISYKMRMLYFKNKGEDSTWVDIQPTISAIPEYILTGDYNSDGLLDILVICDNGYYFLQNKGGNFNSTDGYTKVSFANGVLMTNFNKDYSVIRPGDFNGDGLQDLILNEDCNGKWHLALNNGNLGFNITDLPYIGYVEENFTTKNDDKDRCIITDFNNDGKSDLVIVDATYHKESDISGSWGVFDNTNVYWWASTGNGFTLYKSISSTEEDFVFNKDIVTGDFDGDGREDLINFGANIFSTPTNDINFRLYNSFNTNFEGETVKTIADGFNNKTSFTYQPLSYKTSSTDNFYTKGTSSTYPLADIQIPLYCVKAITSPNGIGGTTTASYTYESARVHLTGKGFLGFAAQKTENEVSNRKMISTFELDESNLYLPKKQTVSVQTAGGTTLSSSVSNYTNTKAGNSYYSYLSSTVNIDNITSNKTTTTYDYSNNPDGNLYRVTTSQPGGFWKEMKYEDYIAAGSWLPNKPQKVTATQNHPDDGTPFRSTTLYEYNTTTGNLTKEIANSGVPGKEVTTTYSNFDTWGHPLTSTSNAISEGGDINNSKTIVYDSKGRYIKSVSDNSGTVSSEYDPVYLTLTSSKDINGLKTGYRYDTWGRLIETCLPDGNTINNSTTWGSVNDATKPFYYTLSSATGKPWVKKGYDKLGRVVHEETVGFNGISIYSLTKYNAKGQVEQRTSYNNGEMTSHVNYTYYTDGSLKDGQLLSESHINGNFTSYNYYGKTVAKSINSKNYVNTYDSWGNIKSVTEPSPGGTISYTYSSNGKPSSITYPSAIVQLTYDELGYQKTLSDPSSGNLEYRYDALGRLTYQKDGNKNETNLFYDNLGRLDHKTNKNGTIIAKYKYYTSGGGNGQVEKVTTALNDTWESYEYDEYGRQVKSTNHIDGTIGDVVFQTHYDPRGNVDQIIYPGNYLVAQQYDGYGNLTSVQGGGATLWTLNAITASSLKYTLGNGQVTEKKFDPFGPLKSIVTANGATQASYYEFDLVKGVLKSREDRRTGFDLKESFIYDDLNRLTDWKVEKPNSPTQAYSVRYDKSNITQKTGIGTYRYEGAGEHPNAGMFPHAVKYIDPETNGYSPLDQNLEYTEFGKVKSITENGYKLDFTYGTDEQRVKSVLTQGGSTLCTNYYAGLYEVKKTSDGNTKEYYYITAGDGVAAVLIKTNGNTGNLYYLHKDHLGSIVCLTDASGAIAEQMSFDPWGRRRNPSDWSFNNVSTSTLLTRGFTGHEHLNEFAMINMNGRVYDPMLGMFISPDNFVQSPTSSQNFNRYAYCLNNPLIYTDPSGDFIHLIIGAAICGVLNWATHGAEFNWKGLGYFGVGAVAGALSAGVGVGIQTASAGASFWAGFVGSPQGISTILSVGYTSSFMTGAAAGGSAGLASGFVTGFGNALVDGKNFGQALGQGGIYGAIGLGSGALIGGFVGGIDAVRDGREFWNGARMIDEQSLANQNLPLVQQRGEYNCGPASGESTTGVSQYRYRTIIGGDSNNDPVTIAQLNDAIKSETGRSASPFLNTLPTDRTGAEQLAGMMNRGNNFYLGSTTPGQPIGHATALNSITLRTFQKISGDLYYKVIYQAMDPAQGVYRIIGANSMRAVIRIYP